MQNVQKNSITNTINCDQIIFTETIIFQKIVIKVQYKPFYFKSGQVSHVQIQSQERNPLSVTGYRSAFLVGSEFNENWDYLTYVIETLENEAKKPEWAEYLKQKQNSQLQNSQLSLF